MLTLMIDVYKEIGDSEDIERLDNLLDGQSHRLQLSATVRGDRDQLPPIVGKNKDVPAKRPEKNFEHRGAVGTKGSGSKVSPKVSSVR